MSGVLVNVRLLIDEDLSPHVARTLRGDGFDVVSVRDRGLLGARDHRVLKAAYQEDRILVTANVRDFERLARAVLLHPGIVLVMNGELLRDEQVAVVREAIHFIAREAEQGHCMVNRVLWIELDRPPRVAPLPPDMIN